MKIALIDDEPLARDYLLSILSGLSGLEVIATYKNGREAIAGLQREPVDVAFLDVEMPGLTGIDVIKALQSDIMPLVVFATAHSEFAVDAFELHAVDYILKPFAEERVSRRWIDAGSVWKAGKTSMTLSRRQTDRRARGQRWQHWAPLQVQAGTPRRWCDLQMLASWLSKTANRLSWWPWMISIGLTRREITCAFTPQGRRTFFVQR